MAAADDIVIKATLNNVAIAHCSAHMKYVRDSFTPLAAPATTAALFIKTFRRANAQGLIMIIGAWKFVSPINAAAANRNAFLGFRS